MSQLCNKEVVEVGLTQVAAFGSCWVKPGMSIEGLLGHLNFAFDVYLGKIDGKLWKFCLL